MRCSERSDTREGKRKAAALGEVEPIKEDPSAVLGLGIKVQVPFRSESKGYRCHDDDQDISSFTVDVGATGLLNADAVPAAFEQVNSLQCIMKSSLVTYLS